MNLAQVLDLTRGRHGGGNVAQAIDPDVARVLVDWAIVAREACPIAPAPLAVEHVATPTGSRHGVKKLAVLRCLMAATQRMSLPEIARVAELDSNTVSAYLTEFWKAGWARRVGRRKLYEYSITERGMEEL